MSIKPSSFTNPSGLAPEFLIEGCGINPTSLTTASNWLRMYISLATGSNSAPRAWRH